MSLYRHKRPCIQLIAEINVVPYIDVMLVLLVIFMIATPMLTQGINVELPQSTFNVIDVPESISEVLVVSVDAEGNFYTTISDKPDQPINAQQLITKVAAQLLRKPSTPVMVRGDSRVNYGQVVTVMVLLQKAGASSVGLITEQLSIHPVL